MVVYVYPALARARMYVWDGSNWVRVVSQDSTGNVRVSVSANGNVADVGGTLIDSYSTAHNSMAVKALLFGFNGSNWDRIRTHILSPEFVATEAGSYYQVNSYTGLVSHTWQVVTDASGAPVAVRLSGSIDGTNWFGLDTWSGTGSTMRHVVNKPVRVVRLYVDDMGDATEVRMRYFGMR